jgi:hypothetical protein
VSFLYPSEGVAAALSFVALVHSLRRVPETTMTHEELTAYFTFLDDLRRSGAVNMFGAAPILESAFDGLDRPTARLVFLRWMESFDDDKTPVDRARTFATV